MKIFPTAQICVLAILVTLSAGCGSEEEAFGSVSAQLIIPRDLASDLASITVYLYQLELGSPSCDDLEFNADAYKNYESSKFKEESYPFDSSTANPASMDGIPNKGPVWRFFARGFDSIGIDIGAGCNGGAFDITPDSPTSVSITIKAFDPN